MGSYVGRGTLLSSERRTDGHFSIRPDSTLKSNRMKPAGRVTTSISSKSIDSLFKSSAGKIPPALWGLVGCFDDATTQRILDWYADGNDSPDSFDLSDEHLKQIAARADALCANLTDDSAGIELADSVEALVIAHVLVAAGKLSEDADERWLDVRENKLWKLSSAALRCDSITELHTKSIGLEIGLVLACAQNDRQDVLRRGFLEEFESIIDANLDSDGWPDSRLLQQIGELAGCWSRIFAIFKSMDFDLDGGVQIQLEWLTRQCLRLMQADGSLGFAEIHERAVATELAESFDKAYWRSIASMSTDPDDAVIFQLLMAKGKSKKGKKSGLTPLMANDLVEPYNVSEWAGSFLLRGTWSPKAPRVAVDFSYQDSHVAGGGQPGEQCFAQISRAVSLIHGQTLPEIIVDDQAVRLTSSFEVVCERHDDDVDYMEIEAELSDGGTLNRQWLLARTEEFLLVADTVLPAGSAKIEYRCRWPLAAGMTTLEESETREVYLQTSGDKQKIKALVLPVALPEWKAEKFPGKLVAEPDAVVLEQQIVGDALYAPLVFDLNPSRSLEKRTWRKLTVAQERQTVADDQAMAFRFQLGKRQWFFYRALGPAANRTFLGENVTAEFVFNRFHKSGKVTSLFEVE